MKLVEVRTRRHQKGRLQGRGRKRLFWLFAGSHAKAELRDSKGRSRSDNNHGAVSWQVRSEINICHEQDSSHRPHT